NNPSTDSNAVCGAPSMPTHWLRMPSWPNHSSLYPEYAGLILIELKMYCVNWMFCWARSAPGIPMANNHVIILMYLICIVLIGPNDYVLSLIIAFSRRSILFPPVYHYPYARSAYSNRYPLGCLLRPMYCRTCYGDRFRYPSD